MVAKRQETAQGVWGLGFRGHLEILPVIVENQTAKQVESEMETRFT